MMAWPSQTEKLRCEPSCCCVYATALSDSFCVDRYRSEFLSLMRDRVVDILFTNESELHALYQTSDFGTAVDALRQETTNNLAMMTLVIAAFTTTDQMSYVAHLP